MIADGICISWMWKEIALGFMSERNLNAMQGIIVFRGKSRMKVMAADEYFPRMNLLKRRLVNSVHCL